MRSGTAEAFNSTFVNNTAVYGGLAYATAESRVSLKNCSRSHNRAVSKGGVLYIAKESFILMQGSRFTNNTAGESGGVLSAEKVVKITVYDCTLTTNSAMSGGIVYGSNINITIQHSAIHSNIVRDGMLNIFQSMCKVTESIFTHNTATNTGGTIVMDRGILYINKSVFMGNSATQGGAVYAINALVSLHHCNCSKQQGRGQWWGGLCVLSKKIHHPT